MMIPSLIDGTVSVIDGTTDAVVTTILIENPFGIDINPITNKIYVANNEGFCLCD